MTELYDKLKKDISHQRKVLLLFLTTLLLVFLEIREEWISDILNTLPIWARALILVFVGVFIIGYAGLADRVIDWILTEEEHIYLQVVSNSNKDMGFIQMTHNDWRRQTIKNAQECASFRTRGSNDLVYLAKEYDWENEIVYANWRKAADPLQVERYVKAIEFNEKLYKNEVREAREINRALPALRHRMEQRAVKLAQQMVDKAQRIEGSKPLSKILEEHVDAYQRLEDEDISEDPDPDISEDLEQKIKMLEKRKEQQ